MLSPSDQINQLAIDIAVLKEQIISVKESMDRIEKALTENGLINHGVRIESLEKARAWLVWVLGAVVIGVIVNFVRVK